MKNYGESVDVVKFGSVDPNESSRWQWQRKTPGSSTWANILNEKSTSYIVVEADKGAKLRVQQTFAYGTILYSNEIGVTTADPLPPSKTLGTVTVEGPDELGTNAVGEYTISWTGDAEASDIDSFVWATDANTVGSPTKWPSEFSWNSTKENAFVWAQLNCSTCDDSGAKIAQKDNIKIVDKVLEPGTPLGGGYVAGVIKGNGEYNGTANDGMNDLDVLYYVIVSPKSGGSGGSKKWKNDWTYDPERIETSGGLRPTYEDAPEWMYEAVLDRVYGKGSTETFADSKHPLFNWVVNGSDGPRKTNLGGENDWYVPSYYELEICLANLKPGTNNMPSSGTGCCGSNGQNPYSVPVGPGYTSSYPRQTSSALFKQGGAQAFSAFYDYKSSSQNARGSESSEQGNYYLGRSFDRGDNRKTSKTSSTSKARVIRRVPV